MNLKRRMALIRSNLEPKIENKLVLICPKLEPGKKQRQLKQIQNRAEEIRKDVLVFRS